MIIAQLLGAISEASPFISSIGDLLGEIGASKGAPQLDAATATATAALKAGSTMQYTIGHVAGHHDLPVAHAAVITAAAAATLAKASVQPPTA